MDWQEKVAGITVFGVLAFASAWFGLGDVMTDIFLALLSAYVVLPPVAATLRKMFKTV